MFLLTLRNYLRQFPEIQLIFSSFFFQYSSVEPKTTITLIYTDGIREEVELNLSHTLVNIYQYVMFRDIVVYAKDHIVCMIAHLLLDSFVAYQWWQSPSGRESLY